jgi:signal transduction histidine kinase
VTKLYCLLYLCLPIYLFAQPSVSLLSRYHQLDSAIELSSDNKPVNALPLCAEQTKIAKQLGDDSLVYCATTRHAKLLNSLGLFEQSMQEWFAICTQLHVQHTDDLRLAECYQNIASIFRSMADYTKAIDYFNQSKQIQLIHHQGKDTCYINSEIALCMAGIGEADKAISLALRSIQESIVLNDTFQICNALDNLSNIYYEKKQYDSSIKYQLKIWQYPNFVQSNLHRKTALNEHLAEIYSMAGQYSKAQSYLDSAFIFAKIYGSNDWLYECYRWQAAIDEHSGNYKRALANHKTYLLLKDSVYQSQYDTKMSAMASLYELEHKQYAITNLEKDKELKEGKIRQLYLIIAGLVVLLLAIYLFINYRSQKMRRELAQQFARQLLQAQETERQRIARDLHDSVGQNILFIKNQVQQFFKDDNPALSQSVDHALDEVRNISKDLYPNQLERYGLVAAVEALCDKVKGSSDIFVSSDIQLPDTKLDKETQINCYRIIQECINNTLKHAAATAIRITGVWINGAIHLTIQDNGMGFEKTILAAKAQQSFGMLNLEERVRLLRGRFELETAPGHGVKFMFVIPVG